MNKTAIVFGATGLVGSFLIKELAKNSSYSKITAFNRRLQYYRTNKIEEVLIDFYNPNTYIDRIKGDDVFICLGTTIKKAGTIEKMEQLDRDLPAFIAYQAKLHGASGISIISSVGANKKSKNYYLRIKGELEQKIKNLNFPRMVIARPSMLLGPRKEQRILEKIVAVLMKSISFTLIGRMRKYRAIHAHIVAKAMISALETGSKQCVFESNELQAMGK